MTLKIVLDKQSCPKEQNCLFDRKIGVCRVLTKFINPCRMEEIFACNLREVGTFKQQWAIWRCLNRRPFSQ